MDGVKAGIGVSWRSRLRRLRRSITAIKHLYYKLSEIQRKPAFAKSYLCTMIFSVATETSVCTSTKYKPLESVDISRVTALEGAGKFCCNKILPVRFLSRILHTGFLFHLYYFICRYFLSVSYLQNIHTCF